MKKLLGSLLIIMFALGANAQEKHSLLIYGSGGFHTEMDTKETNTRGWNAQPGIGFFITKDFAIGLNFGYGQPFSTQDSNKNAGRTTLNEYNAGLFLRHQCRISNTFFFFDQLNGGYMGGFTTLDSLPSFNKYTGFYLNLTPAIGVNVSKCVALNFSIGGITYNNRNDEVPASPDLKSSSFDFNFGRTFNIGVSAFLGGKKMNSGAPREPMMEIRNLDTSDDTPKSDDDDDDDE